MVKETYPRAIEGSRWSWAAHPDCREPGEWEKYLISKRDSLRLFGGIEDEDRSYEFDEYALVGDDKGDFYLLNSSGCSCPSPSEVWNVDFGPATLEQIEEFVKGGHYSGYTLPKQKEEEFLKMLRGWW